MMTILASMIVAKVNQNRKNINICIKIKAGLSNNNIMNMKKILMRVAHMARKMIILKMNL